MAQQRPSYIKTRTYLEVRVGSKHSAEVILHLHRENSWFDKSHLNDLMEVLQSNILPRMFSDEIEASLAQLAGRKVPPQLGPGGKPIDDVGEKNVPRKRKRLTKKQQAELQKKEMADKKPEKEVYYAFGKSLKIAFRLVEPKAKQSVTLLYRGQPKEDKGRKHQGKFAKLTKLSKQIHVWCTQFDPRNPEASENDDFFDRNDYLIPISSLFRQNEVVIDVDDD